MYEYKFILERVIDGDSVVGHIDLGFDTWMMNQHVRLAGIDAPESKRLSYITDEDLKDQLKGYGIWVSNWLNSQLAGVIITVKTQYDNQSDKYGRILGTFMVRDPYTQREFNLNEFMLDSRLAVAYNGTSSRSFLLDEHISNMQYNIEQGLYEGYQRDTD